ncbi:MULTISPECIES: SDR family NAD(P)-dependent oxidoreductase [unclassified Iodidimonas]|jgi:short-subunit dehydrogenase|uniref:SDR family NAD(P)-dependent oxidoreductase n=1 Tax=unclassified Iodidimonas TaxID=2626145 RepID=UPI002482A85B|nr:MULTISPECIES: SDR family NAD(P)-dependent oxidoreductase [unclassified Iodidimonas]
MTEQKAGSILITGASSGIGEALALHYAKPGVFLALSGRDQERLDAIAQSCRGRGADVDAQIIDVVDEQAMRQWIEQVDDAHPLDLLIANAGIGLATSKDRSLHETTKKTFAINVTGVFNSIHPALERMKKRQGGQIAIMASVAGFRGMPGAASYSASKVAVKAYGEALRGAYWGRVKVNVICPGFVESRMTAQNRFPMPFLMTADKAARIIAKGLRKNKGVIAFPFPTAFAMRFLTLLPQALSDAILRRSPQK